MNHPEGQGGYARKVQDTAAERDRLKAANAELLEALVVAWEALDSACAYVESGGLDDDIDHWNMDPIAYVSAMIHVRAALDSTPAEVLERAKARDEVMKAARFIAETTNYLHPEGELRHAVAKLDALDQGDGT